MIEYSVGLAKLKGKCWCAITRALHRLPAGGASPICATNLYCSLHSPTRDLGKQVGHSVLVDTMMHSLDDDEHPTDSIAQASMIDRSLKLKVMEGWE